MVAVAWFGGGCRDPEPAGSGGPPAGTEALPTLRMAAPQAADDKLDPRFRAELLPQVRRETMLRIVVDLAVQPDLVAIAARADVPRRSRADRIGFVTRMLGRGVPAAKALAAELRARPDTRDVVEMRCMARIAFTGPARLAGELTARDDVMWAWGRALEAVPSRLDPLVEPPGEGGRWGPQAIGAVAAWQRGYAGRGAHACVMDSAAARVPRLLEGRLAASAAEHPAPGSGLPDEGRGHGFAVLGAAVGADGIGVAPEATWSIVNPLGGGVLDPEQFALAVDWLLATARPDVVVMPWDVPDVALAYQLAVPIGALRTAGIAVAFPAGNTGPLAGSNRPPANLVDLAPDGAVAFSVGGVNADLGAYPTSSRGPNARDGSAFPLVAAPAGNVSVVDREGGGIRAGHGTSYAVGFAGGALVLVLAAHPSMTGPEAESLLARTARDLGEPGPDTTFGHGLIDVAKALEMAGGAPAGTGGTRQ